MTPTYWFLAAIILFMIVGLWEIQSSVKQLVGKINFIKEYREKFNQLVSGASLNQGLYEWLTIRTNRIQGALGSFGLLDYKPAFANYIHRNYPIIPNALSEIRTSSTDPQTIAMCDDCMLRALGVYEELLESEREKRKNPFIWLREGIAKLLSGPIYILSWLGVTSESIPRRFQSSSFSRVASGIISIVVLLGTAISIVTGWSKFTEIVRGFF